MREIVFRGKRDDGEWVEGNLFRPDLENADTQICIGTPTVRISYSVIPETVGQFTGLTDKNDKKIFEGDIIARKTRIGRESIEGVVKYGKFNCFCCGGVYGWYVDGDGDIREFKYPDACQYVVGNIHDNPELLEREDDRE